MNCIQNLCQISQNWLANIILWISYLQSFSELFVKFLERESTPTPQMRLPAEQMAREQQERHQQERRTKAAFNPFSSPVTTTTVPQPVPVGGATNTSDSHILMKPMTASSLPMFSPLVAAEGMPLLGGGGGSGRGSANSSGRSTPASSITILKDVLH